jgi:hypothetical protein
MRTQLVDDLLADLLQNVRFLRVYHLQASVKRTFKNMSQNVSPAKSVNHFFVLLKITFVGGGNKQIVFCMPHMGSIAAKWLQYMKGIKCKYYRCTKMQARY